jgi:Bacteriophage Sf6, terminase small subunit-like
MPRHAKRDRPSESAKRAAAERKALERQAFTDKLAKRSPPDPIERAEIEKARRRTKARAPGVAMHIEDRGAAGRGFCPDHSDDEGHQYRLTEAMTTEKKNKPSLRPVDYTREIGSTICGRLFNGETLSEICRDAAMPDKPTVMRWLAQHPKFLDEYVFTCELLVDDLAAEAVSIADTDTECRERVRGAKVVTISGREELARCLLRLAIRQWVAERLIPKIVPQS